MGHKNSNAPLILKVLEINIFFVWRKTYNGAFLGVFPDCPSPRSGQFRGQKGLSPLEKPREMPH
jgi:hypothetical protein